MQESDLRTLITNLINEVRNEGKTKRARNASEVEQNQDKEYIVTQDQMFMDKINIENAVSSVGWDIFLSPNRTGRVKENEGSTERKALVEESGTVDLIEIQPLTSTPVPKLRTKREHKLLKAQKRNQN
ncbi:hypothetical protein CHS0354_033488 [Potamilus streckersoni]|uniref:Uncharacterized protein n=1 Tax=Potamilus streckersoni TaxID=2493646 RepID=A0AAE0W894_9BIVA|nr:hypothetical protein CHS0354_033488 [Potamilus streckersoni]